MYRAPTLAFGRPLNLVRRQMIAVSDVTIEPSGSFVAEAKIVQRRGHDISCPYPGVWLALNLVRGQMRSGG
jgi:hypothetical protein